MMNNNDKVVTGSMPWQSESVMISSSKTTFTTRAHWITFLPFTYQKKNKIIKSNQNLVTASLRVAIIGAAIVADCRMPRSQEIADIVADLLSSLHLVARFYLYGLTIFWEYSTLANAFD